MDVLYKQINRYGQQELRMNERFYSLSQDKQQRIINAAYKVFALNSYKKAPMSEIANEAEISKALLFHYFRNKKDLYLYLWDNAADLTQKATIYNQAKEKLFRCLQLCGRKRRNQTEVGNLAYPQRGLEAQGRNRKSAAHGNFSPAKQSDNHRVPL